MSRLNVKVFINVSHAVGKDGEGERWSEQDIAGTRNLFDNTDMRTQELIVQCCSEKDL